MDGTLNQPYIVAAALYAGMIAGLVYALFRGVRALFHFNKVATILSDVGFLAILFLITALCMQLATNFKIRPYCFLGIVFGFGIFEMGIAPAMRAIFKLFSKKGPGKGKEVDKPPKKRSNIK